MTGLVLEGGGMRGMFTMGIVDLLCEQRVKVDGIVGVSAGACFGCNYKSHQPGRALRYNARFMGDPRYMSVRGLLRTGNLFDAEFCYHTVPREFDVFDTATFEQDPTEFHLVCTDAVTGEAVYKQLTHVDYDALEWIRATSSMPLVSQPIPLEGRLLLDGGMVDSIPLRHAQELGFDRNIVILTQPRGFRKKPSRIVPLFRLLMRKYPKVAEVMERRHEMYNAQLDYLYSQEASGKVLLIFPDEPLCISRIEKKPAELHRVYQLGRTKGKECLEQIQTFIATK
ncbi:MAG: patatin family protein [Bacteroidaceae bacterium]|nr:patatin family protein [Bacteroidaceae bacterium]